MIHRYVSPDYASTGMLNEGSDVYSFGVLLMEIVTGKSPVDYSRPPGEVQLQLQFQIYIRLVFWLIDEYALVGCV